MVAVMRPAPLFPLGSYVIDQLSGVVPVGNGSVLFGKGVPSPPARHLDVQYSTYAWNPSPRAERRMAIVLGVRHSLIVSALKSPSSRCAPVSAGVPPFMTV